MYKFIAIICLIIAPLTASVISHEHINVQMPKNCQNKIYKNYCPFEGPNYPHEVMEKLKTNIFQRVKDLKPWDNDIGNRILKHPRSECASTSLQNIYYIKDTMKRIRVVVQIKGVFEQIVSGNRCDHPGLIQSNTRYLTKQTAMTYKMYCKDILRQDEFYVLNDNFSDVEKVTIKSGIPVYCACRYDKSTYWSEQL